MGSSPVSATARRAPIRRWESKEKIDGLNRACSENYPLSCVCSSVWSEHSIWVQPLVFREKKVLRFYIALETSKFERKQGKRPINIKTAKLLSDLSDLQKPSFNHNFSNEEFKSAVDSTTVSYTFKSR